MHRTVNLPVAVERWQAWPLEVPLSRPYRSAKGTLASIPMLHTRIVSNEGATGHSLVFIPSLALLKAVVALVASLREDLLPGAQDLCSHATLLRRTLGAWGQAGIAACAASAFELALVDVLSQRASCSIAALFDARPVPLRAYGGAGLDGKDECIAQALLLAADGHRAVKLKIGYSTLDEDVRVVSAVRSALGTCVDLMVDYNQSLSVGQAIERCRALESFGLRWVEEPVPAWDLTGHAAVAEAVATPIQSGENWWQAHQVRTALDLHACDAVMLDPGKLGVCGWMEAAHCADAAGMSVSSHLSPHLCAQMLSTIAEPGWLESSPWWDPFLGVLPVIEGTVQAHDAPLAWNEDALRRHRF